MKRKVKQFLAGLCVSMMLFQSVAESGFVLYASAGDEEAVKVEESLEETGSENSVSVDVIERDDTPENPATYTDPQDDEEEINNEALTEKLTLDGDKLYTGDTLLGTFNKVSGELVIDVNLETVPCFVLRDWADIKKLSFAEGAKTKEIGQPASDESGAFQGCVNLESVDMSNATNLTTVKFHSFDGCTSLKEVKFNVKLNYIEKYAFAGCTLLKEVVFEKELMRIGESAFEGCTSLHKITLKGTATECESSKTFKDCAIDSFVLAESEDKTAVFPARLFEEATFKDGAYISIPDNVVTIGEGAFKNSNIAHVNLPGEKLTSIAREAFSGCENLQEIDFSGCTGLHFVRESAFEKCKSIPSVVLPDNITFIGDYAFSGCESMQTLTLSKGTQKKENLGVGIFEGCKSLQSVEFFAEHQYVSEREFRGCVDLMDVDFSKSNIIEIGDSAFGECESLVIVELPESLIKLGNNCFEYCLFLNYVTFPSRKPGVPDKDQFHEIPDYCFDHCGSLKKAELREGITRVGEYAFLYANAYSSSLPSTLEYIGDNAFNTCSFHGELVLPEKLNHIGAAAFKGCADLFGADSQYEKINKVVIKPKDIEECGEQIFMDCYISEFELAEGATRVPANLFNQTTWETGKTVIIPNTVVEIGRGAFAGESSGNVGNIKELVFEEGSRLTTIEDDAFRYNSTFVSVELPETVKSIGAHAFANCNKLASITVPEGVKKIGEGAFEGCSLLETVIFNAISVEECERNIFSECNIKTVVIGNKVTVFPDYLFYGAQFQKNESGKYILVDLMLPASVKRIGDYSLTNVVNLENLSFEKGSQLEEIGQYAFSGCSELKSIVFPDSLKVINSFAFFDCKKLAGIKLPANLEVLGEGAFKDCVQITEVNIPASIAEIRYETFSGCEKLSKAVFEGTKVENIYNSAFYGCKELKNVNLPEGLLNIDSSAFEGCIGLGGIDIPKSVTNIGYHAFSACTGIVSVNFAKDCELRSFGEEAFYGCPIGKELILSEYVSDIGNKTFYNTGKNEKTKVYLPVSIQYIGDEAFNIAYRDNLEFYVVTGSAAEEWLVANGFNITESTPEVEMITVTLNYQGYGDNKEVKVPKGGKLSRPTDPTAEGVIFVGWYTDEECKKAYDFDKTVEEAFTLYAKWSKKAEDVRGSDSALDPTPEITVSTNELWLVKGQKFYIGEGWIVKDKTSKKYVSISNGVFKAKKDNGSAIVKIYHDSREEGITIHITKPVLTKKLKLNIVDSKKPATADITWIAKDSHISKVLWYSASPDVATVDQDGKVTAVGKGTAKITAFVNGVAYTCTVKVTEKVTAPERTMHCIVNGKKTIKLKGVKGTWGVVSGNAATMLSKNKVGAGSSKGEAVLKNGDYTINFYAEDIAVSGEKVEGGNKNKYTINLSKGESTDITMPGVYQDVIFKSSKPEVAFIDEEGHVVANSTGSAKLTAKIDGKTVTITVKVQ